MIRTFYHLQLHNVVQLGMMGFDIYNRLTMFTINYFIKYCFYFRDNANL